MDREELKELYFNWLYSLAFPLDDGFDERFKFTKLLRYLHSVDFYSPIEMDENRASDGIDLRYDFGWEKGYSDREITTYLDDRQCSVLEMMIALAIRCEKQFMQNNEYGNRTSQWFKKMISSLGLRGMYNARYDQEYSEFVVKRFLNHDYQPNGDGGLFFVKNSPKDLRSIEIWAQLMAFLNTIN